jgi:UDP-3-O-[3-hydroxymyristoyl] glucosamine N-acyltransferase
LFDNVVIGHQVQLGGMAVVTKDLPDGMKAGGFPAQDLQLELREKASIRRLAENQRKILDLIERVERLESSAHHNP